MTNDLSLQEAILADAEKISLQALKEICDHQKTSEMDEEPSDDPLDFIYQSGGQLTRKEIEQRVQEYRRRKALQPTG